MISIMPLVRVTGVDADAFDISDVAKMNDHNHSRKTWHSRIRSNPKSSDTEETPSTDSSSMVSSMVYSDRDSGGSGGRHSFASVNFSHSILLSKDSTGSGTNIRHCNNFENYYADPRNPFDTHKIPEEDEEFGSSALEDCSLSSSNHSPYNRALPQQQILRRSNSNNPSHSSMSSRHSSSSQKQQQQRHRQLPSSLQEEDDISSTSSVQTNSLRKDAYTQQLVAQLESQVAKLNFELATTKSSLDQLQLENRRLHEEKSVWHKDLQLLQEENDQLRMKIERMEREKLVRTMESTKGVARGRNISMDVGSCVVWSGSSVSGNTWSDIESFKQETKRASVEKFQVPLDTNESEKRHTYSRARRRTSASSTGSLHSYADDVERSDVERSSGRLSVGDLSVGSINLDNSEKSQVSDEKKLALTRPSFIGAATQKLQEMGVQLQEKVSLASNMQGTNNGSVVENKPTQSNNQSANAADDEKSGQIEEDYDDDDPFATWSENRNRSFKKNWFKRGDGLKPQSVNIDTEEDEERIEDPFDTAKWGNKESEYTSFAENSSLNSEDEKGKEAEHSKRGLMFWQRNEKRSPQR